MPDSPHQAAWNEARHLLAAAERAAASREPSALGGAVAQIDSAISLLEHLLRATDEIPVRRLLANAWSLRARTRHAVNTPDALADAIRALQTVVEVLDDARAREDRNAAADLAVAHHNVGNLRHLRAGEGDAAAALDHFDRAIALLRDLPTEGTPALRHVLAVTWLHRGMLLVSRDEPESITAAQHAFDAAIALFRSLPEPDRISNRLNLGAALMNRAQTLLRSPQEENALTNAITARATAAEALGCVASLEREHPNAADLGLKARHIACRAIGITLGAAGALAPSRADREEMLAAVSDHVDDGLVLARHWAQRDVYVPFSFVADLFRFGLQTYLRRQPHFLAEFVLENLDPATSADALPFHPTLHALAREAVQAALREFDRPQLQTLDAPDADRRIAARRALAEAAERLDQLQPRTPSA